MPGGGPEVLCAGDWSAGLLLPGLDGIGRPTDKRVGVTGAGACCDVLHGESDAGRGSTGKFEATGGVLRKGTCISELGLRAMGPVADIFLATGAFSASAMIALISTLQKFIQFQGVRTNKCTHLGTVEMERHPPNAEIEPAETSGAGVLD